MPPSSDGGRDDTFCRTSSCRGVQRGHIHILRNLYAQVDITVQKTNFFEILITKCEFAVFLVCYYH